MLKTFVVVSSILSHLFSGPVSRGIERSRYSPRLRSTYQDVPCSNIAPGVLKLSAGIDITNLDLDHSTSSGAIDGIKSSVIKLTCQQGRKITIDGTQYDIPDQIESMFHDPSGVSKGTTESIYTMETKKESMGVDVGVDLSFSKGAFSASSSYKEAQESMKNLSSFVTTLNAYQQTSKATVAPATTLKNGNLHQYLVAYIDQLSGSFESNPQPYMELIDNFGTHYFKSGQMGGRFFLRSVVNSEVRNLRTEEEITADATADFLGILKTKGAWNDSTGTASESYTNNRRHYESYFGGEANLMEEGSYQQWWPTVAKNPWLMKAQVAPITDLVADNTKRQNLEKAVEYHLTKAYLRDLQRIMTNLAVALNDPSTRPREYSERIDSLLSQDHPELYDLQRLAREVEDYTLTPSWFLTNVNHTLSLSSSCPNQDRPYGFANQWFPRDELVNVSKCVSAQLKISTRGQVPDWFSASNYKIFVDEYLIRFFYDDSNRDYAIWLKAVQFCGKGRYYLGSTSYTSNACVRPGIYGFNSESVAPNESRYGLQNARFTIRTSY